MTNSLKSIAIITQAFHRYLIIDFARKLKEQGQTAVHLYCQDEEGLRAYKADEGLFDSINLTDAIPMTFPSGLDENAVVAEAQANEKKYGRPMNWYALINRHFGRGYSPMGFFHPRSHSSENCSYIQYLNHTNKALAYWDSEFKSKSIDMIWNAGFVEAAVARHNGAFIRTPISARYGSLYLWVTDEYWDSSLIAEAYDMAPPNKEEVTIDKGPRGQAMLAKHFAKSGNFLGLLQSLRRKFIRYAYVKYKGLPYRYYLSDELRMFVRQWRRMKVITGPLTKRLEDIGEWPFVFFPLQVEPERNFQGNSPEYYYQQSAILSLSRDLPAGTLLVVKEHTPSAGRRPHDFYKQLRDLKNVILLDAREPGPHVIHQAKAVATINSTAGMEAAMMGKPVITFSRHNTYNVMPHVKVVTDEDQLAGLLCEALSDDFDTQQAKNDGTRFLTALKSMTFDMKDFSYPKPRGYDSQSIDAAYEKLIESLTHP